MILNGTGDNLQAFMAGAAATTNPSFFVTFADIDSTTSAFTPDSAGGALNGTTDVNLVSGVAGAKRMIKNLSICNIDTDTVIVTVQFEDGTDRVIQHVIPISVGKTLYWSLETGWVIQPSDPIAAFRGVQATRTADQVITSGSSTAIAFTSEVYDTSGFHDNSVNNSRLTVPSNVTKVRLAGSVRFDFNATGRRIVFIRMNGSVFIASFTINAVSTGSGTSDISLTVDRAVVEADFFDLLVFQDSGGNLNVDGVGLAPLFSLEVIDPR